MYMYIEDSVRLIKPYNTEKVNSIEMFSWETANFDYKTDTASADLGYLY